MCDVTPVINIYVFLLIGNMGLKQTVILKIKWGKVCDMISTMWYRL